MSSPVPEVYPFRTAVNHIKKERDRTFIQGLYLTASRVSELITQVTPYDKEHGQTRAFGKYVSFRTAKYNGEDVFLLKMPVLKRKAKVTKKKEDKVYKLIGLPVEPKYEPWTLKLMSWVRKYGTLNFDISRMTGWRIVKRWLGKLDPDVHTHSLRHYRITHLITEYNFDPFDLTAYAGWSFKTGMGKAGMGSVSGQLDVYAHLAWRKYFGKLLRPLDMTK